MMGETYSIAMYWRVAAGTIVHSTCSAYPVVIRETERTCMRNNSGVDAEGKSKEMSGEAEGACGVEMSLEVLLS